MKRLKETRVVSIPARPNRPRCQLCGRERLSREEYAWRRKNGYPVWRCQHRRRAPKRNRDLTEALSLVAVLTACALAVVL
jgi:hypothetical protein